LGTVVPLRGPAGESPPPEKEPESDGELVRRALAGDRRAEELLVRRHARAVARLIVRLLGTRRDAEDLSQDVFLAAFEQLDRLENPDIFRSWLLRIAVNKVRMVIRKRKMLRLIGLDRTAPQETLEAVAHDDLGPEARAELAIIDRELVKLPAELRIAWVIRHVEGHTLRDVSTICGCSLATAKRRVAAAHERILEVVDTEVLRHGRQ